MREKENPAPVVPSEAGSLVSQKHGQSTPAPRAAQVMRRALRCVEWSIGHSGRWVRFVHELKLGAYRLVSVDDLDASANAARPPRPLDTDPP